MALDWHTTVYQPLISDTGLTHEEWILLRNTVIRRDNFRCLRCDKRFASRKLSAHHMMPRAEGGSNDLGNLVTLCNECHDFVEINGLKTRAEIVGSIESETEQHEPIEELKRPDWHAFVYGGKRRRH